MALFFQTLSRVRHCRRCPNLNRVEWSLRRRSSSPASTSEEAIDKILSKPTWSVQSLLPDSSSAPQEATVTPKQLHHLLRLSALPQPTSEADEKDMLQTLESQIHFVNDIRRTDTDAVAPLRSIRDETPEAHLEGTVGLGTVKSTLDREVRVGRARKIRRTKADKLEHPDGETWNGDALGAANKKMGQYFVVQSGSD